jgi:hypothetical protein
VGPGFEREGYLQTMQQLHFYVTVFSNASQKLYTDNTLATFTTHLAQPIDLDPNDRWEVGICKVTCPPPIVGTLRSNVLVGDTNVLIYCNLIAPQFVGGNLVRCLRTFISPTHHCQQVFETVYYVPVEKRRFQDIRIELLNLEGKRVNFRDRKTPVKVVLHFRRV